MGIYINKGNEGFRQIRNSEYIDKSGLISVVNKTLFTRQKMSCVTRCRRFGKSMAAEMLAAYYDHSCDSRSLFADLQIAADPTFEQHLNKYPVIYVDMTTFTANCKDEGIVTNFQEEIIKDVRAAYPQVEYQEGDHLMKYLQHIVAATGDRFVMIIDEWDAVCRIFEDKPETMDRYLDLLRRMFKDVSAVDVFAGVYMTGILPIKKYNTQSAMNNFEEYSMVKPGALAPFFGFTKEEVCELADKYGMDFEEMEKWYDGYQIGPQPSMFNPNSVMTAIREQWCENYWGKTGATNSISGYIQRNYEGLKDDIVRMIAGERCDVDPKGFKNDLTQINSRDDVLTVLIHLGYLSYDRRTKECYIPNMEVMQEMENAIRDSQWKEVTRALEQSKRLVEATLRGDGQTVARMVGEAHTQNASIIKYNDENSMACVLSIAYYYAHGDYIFHREFQTGLGFADLVLIPRKNVNKPAVIVELKYGNSADEAVDQIKTRHYPDKVAEYMGDILLVGINYDRDTKEHTCQIERWHKD